MSRDETVCILTAAYNDWPSLQALIPLLDEALAGKVGSVRVVVVDDGSAEEAPADLLAGQSYSVVHQVDALTLIRNLGNQRALSVGVGWVAAHVDCDWLVVMDADHEDRPEVISDLLDAARAAAGSKIVFAARTDRSEGLIFKAFYAVYKRLYGALTGMSISIGNFSIVPRRLLRRLAGVWEIGLHFPAGVMKARLPFTSIGAARGRRAFGESKMNLVNLVVHGFSGLAVHAEVVAVRVVVGTAALSGLILLYLAQVLYEKLFTTVPILGWTSQIVAVLSASLFQAGLMGLLMLFLVLNARTQRPMIPYRDADALVLESIVLYPPA
jgi:hypothetical protein